MRPRCIARGVLAAALLCLSVAPGCSKSGQGSCDDALVRYWASRDIDPYFSALPLETAARQCRDEVDEEVLRCVVSAPRGAVADCPGASALPIDDGWKAGLFCFDATGPTASRCERSNRECEHYRQLGVRAKTQPGACRAQDSAWAIQTDGGPVFVSPSRGACETARSAIELRGVLGPGAVCAEVRYDDLARRGRRAVIAAPPAL